MRFGWSATGAAGVQGTGRMTGRRALRQSADAAVAAFEKRSRLFWIEQRRLALTLARLKLLPVGQVLVGSLEKPHTAEQADVAPPKRRRQILVELPALFDDVELPALVDGGPGARWRLLLLEHLGRRGAPARSGRSFIAIGPIADRSFTESLGRTVVGVARGETAGE